MAVVFSTASRHQYNHPRENHGKPWATELLIKLRSDFNSGHSLPRMCIDFGRTADSILAKLCNLNLIREDRATGQYNYVDASLIGASNPQPQQEPTMNKIADDAPTIENKTFIRGVDAALMSDAQIFSLMAKLELEAVQLRTIRTRSTKLDAAIKQLEDDVVALAAYVDAR